jgi:predicted RNA binding protein YcfA (HicA-like mRNA interferase family)
MRSLPLRKQLAIEKQKDRFGGPFVFGLEWPCMKVRDLIRTIEQDGWYLTRTRGSHRQYHHDEKTGTVTVSGHPSDEVPLKTLSSALRQAGLK